MIKNNKIDLIYFTIVDTLNKKSVSRSLRYFTVFFTGFVARGHL